MALTEDLAMYARFVRSLPGFLRIRTTPEDGRRLLREQLDRREDNFVESMRLNVFGHEASPYLALLRQAGCELGDLESTVRREGVEDALLDLHAAGVKLSFEQVRGREPLEVNGRQHWIGGRDLDNPALAGHLHTATSGSTGRPARQPIDLGHRAKSSNPIAAAIADAQGLFGLRWAMIREGIPDTTWVNVLTSAAQRGDLPERWWTPGVGGESRPPLRFRAARSYIELTARAVGTPFPRPEPLPLGEVTQVAEWAREAIAVDGSCVLRCTPSMGLRVALAAREAEISLRGCVFHVSGEPATEAKVRGMRAVGAEVIASYFTAETGAVGHGCLHPAGVNDQHVMSNHLGVIQAVRRVGDTEVDALLLTTLLPSSSRILLNAEMDDYGVLEERACGCPLADLGLRLHVRDVRSFKKLVTEGVCLVGSDMEALLESVLPERFGGSALDYQLVEEEDERGFTRLVIRVDPAIEIVSDDELRLAVLEGLREASFRGELVSRLWEGTETLRVRHEPPKMSRRGKLLPLELSSRPG